MKISTYLFAAFLAIGCVSQTLAQQSIIFDFDDGTLQGWTNIVTATTANGNPGQWGVNGSANTFPISDNGGLAPDLFADRDEQADSGILARSTAFTLLAADENTIDFTVLGGDLGTATLTGSTDANITTATADSIDFQGVALRRESDGAYLLSNGKSANSNDSETIIWDDALITSVTNGDALNETYTLDLVDTQGGGWGWFGLDNASITSVSAVPEPSSAALLGLAGLALLVRRKR